MKTRLIGLGCKARQGKGTVARAIHCAFPERTWIFALADALKAYCRVNGWMGEKDGGLLQIVGSDIFRQRVNADQWVRVLTWTIEEFAADYGCRYAIITDVRFPNEAEWIRRSEGCLVKVLRTNDDGSPFVAADRDPKHISEVDLDEFTGWDASIQARSGDLVGLASKALEAFKHFTDLREPAHARGDLEHKVRELVDASREGYGAAFAVKLRELRVMLGMEKAGPGPIMVSEEEAMRTMREAAAAQPAS